MYHFRTRRQPENGRNYTSTDDEHLINLSVGSDNGPLISHLNTICGTTNIDLKNYNHYTTQFAQQQKTHNGDHPRKAGKYVQRLSDEL